MAHMYPEELFECTIPSEKEIFHIFKNFSDDFHIIHSYPWLKDYFSHKYTPEGEIDFIILHRQYGILCVEIKGGMVKFDNHAFFNNGGRIKNPILQVRDNAHFLRQNISSLTTNILVGYGIGFPHISSETFPDDNSFITFDKTDLDNLELRIIDIYKYWANKIRKQSPSSDTINKIIRHLLPKNKNIIKDKIEYDNKHWLTLSEEQNKIIERALNQKRFFIAGMAGTGKTVIATILARVLGKKHKILFLFPNKNISEIVKSSLESIDNIDVLTFHAFLYQYNNSIDNLKDIFEDLIKNIPNNYDILIVDEAQGLSEWLLLLAKYFDNKRVYIFSDIFQTFSYESSISWHKIKKIFDFKENEIINLSVNFRSPKKVYDRLSELKEQNIQTSTNRVETDMDLEEIVTNNPHMALKNIIDKLLDNNINKEEIVVLISGLHKDYKNMYEYKNVQVETVPRYRGMEVPIVIYLPKEFTDKAMNEFYVAYSRSTTKTFVIASSNDLNLGHSHYEKLLLQSDITKEALKNSISSNAMLFENNILSNSIEIDIFNYKFYFKNNMYIFMDTVAKDELLFIKKLIIEYLNNLSITVIERKLADPKIFRLLVHGQNNLKYDWCDACKVDTFISKDFCANCINKTDAGICKNANTMFELLSDMNPKYGKTLPSELRSIARYFYVGLDKKLSFQCISALSGVSSRAIGSIIDILIVIDRNYVTNGSKGNFIIELKTIKNHKRMRQATDNEIKSWQANIGVAISSLITHKVLEKLSQGKYIVDIKKLYRA